MFLTRRTIWVGFGSRGSRVQIPAPRLESAASATLSALGRLVRSSRLTPLAASGQILGAALEKGRPLAFVWR